jgi:predicted nuclease of predicted toxin-antitoxin system
VKFLIDNQLPVSVAHWLAGKGHDAIHVLDLGLGQSDDRAIWSLAASQSRIVASKDEDFFTLATRPNDGGRLLWIRIGNCRNQALLQTLETSWPAIETAFISGQQIVELR